MRYFSEVIDRLGHCLSLVKFTHTVFALPFAMIGFVLGVKEAEPYHWGWLLVKVLLCMVTARNAAMGFNRYCDRNIDARNPRTSGREIPAGILSAPGVLWFVIINCILFVSVAFSINPLCGILSPAALLILLGYSYMKRFSALCHFVLGLALGIAPLGAYIAVTGAFAWPPAILTAIIILWSGSFDILYALADEQFDKDNKLHSAPAFMGRRKAMILSGILHAAVIPLLALFYFVVFTGADAGITGGFAAPYFHVAERAVTNWWYISGAIIFSVLLIYQHCIITPGNIKRLNAAFFTSNGIASILFAVFTIIALLW